MNSRKTLWSLVPTAGVYGASVLAMLSGEAALSRAAGPEVYGSFRLVLNIAPVIVSLGFMGYTSAVSRKVAEGDGVAIGYTRPVSFRMAMSAGIALIGAIGLAATAGIPIRIGVSLVPFVVGLALLTHVSGVQRSLGKPVVAALSQQGYRLVGGIGLVAVSLLALQQISPEWLMATCTLVLGVIMLVWLVRYPQQRVPREDEHKQMVRLGHGFFLSAVTVSLTEFMDQFLIVASEGGTELAGVYSTLKLFLVAPVVSVAAVLSFIALPTAVKFVRERGASDAHKSVIAWFAFSLLAGGAVGPVAAILYKRFYGAEIDGTVLAILVSVGVLRLFYVWTSALLGAITQKLEMHALGIAGLAGVGLMPIVFWILNEQPVLGAATAVGVSYLIRNGIAVLLTLRSLRRLQRS